MSRVIVFFIVTFATSCLAKEDEKILFGYPVSIEDCPYQAWLGHCGGVILSEQYILTAAHCGKISKVGVGSANRTELSYYEVEETIIHEEYTVNGGYPFNDLSLVKLKENLTFSETIQSIELSNLTSVEGDTALATGFGVTEEGWISSYLRGIEVTIISKEDCQCRVENYEVDLRNNSICTDNELPYHHVFFGDSGGPLVSNKDRKLIGIASWVVDDFANNLSGFVDLSLFQDWIRKTAMI